MNLRLLRGHPPEANRISLEWDPHSLSGRESSNQGVPNSLDVPGEVETAASGTGGGSSSGATGEVNSGNGKATADSTLTTATTTAILAMASPPILNYVLEFSEASESPGYSRRIEIPGEKTQVKVDNLSPASVYLFRVRAINSAGSGPPSAYLLVRTANVPPSVPPNNVCSFISTFLM